MKSLPITAISLLIFILGKTQSVKSKNVDTIKNIPMLSPTIYTCNQDNEYMFKGCSGVRAEMKNFGIEKTPVKVEKFTISIIKKSGDIIILENVGAYYQTASIKALSNLNVGEKVSLSDFIVTVGLEKTPRKLTQVLSSVYSGKEYEIRH